MEKILSCTNCLSVQLQSKEQTIIEAIKLADVTNSSLLELRNEEACLIVYQEAERFAESVGLSRDNARQVKSCKRIREVSKKLEGYCINSTTGNKEQLSTIQNDGQSEFRIQVFYPAIDKVTQEIDRRLTENIDLIDTLSCFDVKSEEFLLIEKLERFANHYETIIGVEIKETLICEVFTAKKYLRNVINLSNMFEVYERLSSLPASFKCLITLFKITLTLPVSVASNERFFSTLKRVKSYIRSTSGDDRLSHLLLMATEQEFVKSLDLESLVDDFAKMRHRYPL